MPRLEETTGAAANNRKEKSQGRRSPMGRPIIVVVDADKEQCRKLCSLLIQENYETVGLHYLPNLEETVQKTSRGAVILDLDSLVVDNRFIKNFKRRYPDVPIMALSSRSYHPELEQSMSNHICACFKKPPDPDEIIYGIKGFCQ